MMNEIITIQKLIYSQKESHQLFEVRDRVKESDVRSDVDLEVNNPVVSEEQKAHMLRRQLNRELNRSSMQRFI